MFMSMFIHLLELSTLILVGLLAFQIYRCYQNYYLSLRVQQAANTSPNRQNLSKQFFTHKLGASSTPPDGAKADREDLEEQHDAAAVVELAYASTLASPDVSENENSRVLNDYIGEFFNEKPETNIQAFRDKKPSKIINPVINISEAVLSTVSSSDEIIKVEEQFLVPVIPELVQSATAPVLTDVNASSFDVEEDDSVITVMPLSALESGDVSDKIMSDKVVHAMLDEANLVCAS